MSYEACGPYYLFYCTIEYSYLSKEGISKSSGKLEYCFTMRKLGTIDNNGNNLGEQWRFLDFNIQDIGALYTRFTPVSDEKQVISYHRGYMRLQLRLIKRINNVFKKKIMFINCRHGGDAVRVYQLSI